MRDKQFRALTRSERIQWELNEMGNHLSYGLYGNASTRNVAREICQRNA
jgi:hypothetical protein